MLFTELRFAVFFAVVFAGAWLVRGNRARKLWLLAASWVFYAGWDPRFLALLLASTAANFVAGRGIAHATSPARRRAWLWGGVVFDLDLGLDRRKRTPRPIGMGMKAEGRHPTAASKMGAP